MRQGPHEIKTIQEALDKSNDGDTIAIAPGCYYENLHVRTDVSLRADVPPFLPAGSEREVHVCGGRGAGSTLHVPMAERRDGMGHRVQKSLHVKLVNLCIHMPHPDTLDQHAIEVDHSRLDLDHCTVTGGTHGIFASGHAAVQVNASVVRSARRAGISLFSGAHLSIKDSQVVLNGEDGLSVCGFSASKEPAGSRLHIETSKVANKTYQKSKQKVPRVHASPANSPQTLQLYDSSSSIKIADTQQYMR